MTTLEKNGGKLFYEVHGAGEPLVILRGLGRSIKHWLGYEYELAKVFKVITLDLRGMGQTTTRTAWSMTMYDLADDVIAVLDDLGIEAAHILGVSLGGMVALATGIKYPGRCKSLIPINASIADDFQLRLTPLAIKTLVLGATVGKTEMTKNLVASLVDVNTSEDVKAEITEKYLKIDTQEKQNVVAVLQQLTAATRFIVKRKLRRLNVPTLVIYGTGDRFVPTINSRRLVQYIPKAQLKPIEKAGHELTLDRPGELKAALINWVQSLAG
jgi:3-oxoadipate enol-lactonase